MMTEQDVQTRAETVLHHRERLNAVLLHIQENLDASLTVESLAAVAGFSPFYFHRLFAAYLHETLSEYVRRIRLEWAARRLIFGSESVTHIALEAGYETPAAFGRAFKKHFHSSPRRFRTERAPRGSQYVNNWQPLCLQPEFRQHPEQEMAYIPCIGPEADSEAIWRLLGQHLGLEDGMEGQPAFVRVCHDRPNPGITEREKMRVDAGMFVHGQSVQPHGRVGVQRLPGGIYAVFRHEGGRREALWQAIYKCWLPQNDIHLREASPYEESVTVPGFQRGRDEAVTIYIPIHGSLYELQRKEKQMSPEIQTTELLDRQMFSLTRPVSIGELTTYLHDAYEQLAKIIEELGIERDGNPVAIYHGHVSEEHDGPVEVGIPVKSVPVGSGQGRSISAAGSCEGLVVRSRVLAGGPVAYTVLTLQHAHFPEILGYYDAVFKWIEDNGHQIADSPREVYLTRPMDSEAEKDELFMEIVWPYK